MHEKWDLGREEISKKMWARNVRFITYSESARQREGREVKRKLKKGKQLKGLQRLEMENKWDTF